MSASAEPQAAVLPCLVIRDFLEPDLVQRLLAHARDNQARFKPTGVGNWENGRIDPDMRVSTGLFDLGDCTKPLEQKLRAAEPDLRVRLGINAYDLQKIDLQLVAHNHGAFYRRHIDTRTGQTALQGSNRIMSGVYYFHAQPRGFSGGALRLYSVLQAGDHCDIEPQHNSLVVFAAFLPHEVMPVDCPSGAFMASRFAINCWFHRKSPAAPSAS